MVAHASHPRPPAVKPSPCSIDRKDDAAFGAHEVAAAAAEDDGAGMAWTEELATLHLRGGGDLGHLFLRRLRHLEHSTLRAAEALEPDFASAAWERADADDFGEPAAADGAGHHLAGEVGA